MNEKKRCVRCEKEKELTEFYKLYDRLNSYCKDCAKEYNKLRGRNKDGYLSALWNSQKSSSRYRGDELPKYSFNELKNWLFGQKLFHELFENWVDSGYISENKPSVDRKSDYMGYTIDNIQLTTWGENRARGHSDRVDGINNKQNKPVSKYTLDEEFVETYYSISEANRRNNIGSNGNITSVCKGIRNSAGGFIWKYA